MTGDIRTFRIIYGIRKRESGNQVNAAVVPQLLKVTYRSVPANLEASGRAGADCSRGTSNGCQINWGNPDVLEKRGVLPKGSSRSTLTIAFESPGSEFPRLLNIVFGSGDAGFLGITARDVDGRPHSGVCAIWSLELLVDVEFVVFESVALEVVLVTDVPPIVRACAALAKGLVVTRL